MVRDLQPDCLAGRIVIDVEVGAFIEAMMQRLGCGRREVVVDVRESAPCQLRECCRDEICSVHREHAFFARQGRHVGFWVPVWS